MTKIYKVGGCVRDKLMGLESNDVDYVVVGATQLDMTSAGYTRVGSSFPVFLHPVTHEEYALARTEQKSGTGHTAFDVQTDGVSLEDDLKRRDFTINAIAEDEFGNLYDPLGGIVDIHNRVLRHCTNAFREDPLRAVRLARFAARFNFTIAPETYKEVLNTPRSEYKSISAQRILLELRKAIESDVLESFLDHLRYLKLSWLMDSVICEWHKDMQTPRKMPTDHVLTRMFFVATLHKEQIAKMEDLTTHRDAADIAVEWHRLASATNEELLAMVHRLAKASESKKDLVFSIAIPSIQKLMGELLVIYNNVTSEFVRASDPSLSGIDLGNRIKQTRMELLHRHMV